MKNNRENINLLEEKIAYLREIQEMNEEEKKKAEETKNQEKSDNQNDDNDSTEWRILKVDIDLVIK